MILMNDSKMILFFRKAQEIQGASGKIKNRNDENVGIHPGKVKIYNPGSFPDDLTPLDFISRNLLL